MTNHPATPRPASRLRLVVAAAAAVLGLLAAAPAALAVNNDNWESPFNAAVNSHPVTLTPELNAQATTQPNEPLSSQGPGTCNGRKMVGTTWYRILGNGGTITVDTSGSNYDTIIAAYLAPTPVLSDGLPCNDDAGTGVLTSAISFPSTAGTAYLIQVGGCDACGSSASTGSLVMNITATDPPRPAPIVVTPPPPPPPPDADLDGIPENGADKCPGVRPTRDANRDGCQDKPRRILSDLSYDFRYLRRGAAIRGIRFSGVKLTRAPKGARVSVTCRRCRTSRGRGVRSFRFTAKRVGTQSMRPLNGVHLLRGAQLTVVVTSPGRLGRRIVVTMGSRRDVVKLSCLAEGSRTTRVPCSTGS